MTHTRTIQKKKKKTIFHTNIKTNNKPKDGKRLFHIESTGHQLRLRIAQLARLMIRTVFRTILTIQITQQLQLHQLRTIYINIHLMKLDVIAQLKNSKN